MGGHEPNVLHSKSHPLWHFSFLKEMLDPLQYLRKSLRLFQGTFEGVCKDGRSLSNNWATSSYGVYYDATRTTFRQRRIAALLQRQEQLKAELTDAKLRLLADPGSWSFDLNVAEHMNPNDEGYLEALTDETELLQQRVDACRSHAQYLAFFQPPTVPLSPAPPPPPPPPPSTGFHESPK
ncbi:unnamed protein product [Hydatigera taeniaeformis]|uniref:Uncharacterized protein n=1 Tax=Hydatigena taeniaeformis TaxID=6205 RepID=A0A0R3WPB8_HYDTA|nr:unnamed protein product [Hydatigera taeniaeformis]